MRLIGQNMLVKTAVTIEISMVIAVFSFFITYRVDIVKSPGSIEFAMRINEDLTQYLKTKPILR
jgi:hypothetical protein